MVAAMCRAFPGRFLPARRPLTGHPPAPDLFRTLGIVEIDDRNDIAEIAVHFRRAVDIAAVERESMHAAGRPRSNVTRVCRFADVEDFKTTTKIRILPADRKDLPVDQHYSAINPHFMRQRAV